MLSATAKLPLLGHGLVAADVQRAYNERAALKRRRDCGIRALLLGLAGRILPVEEEEFSAQQAAAFSPLLDRALGLFGGGEIGEDFDAGSIGHGAVAMGGSGLGGAAGLCAGEPGAGFGKSVRRGFAVERRGIGIEDRYGACRDVQKPRPRRDQHGHARRGGEDGDMGGGAAVRRRYAAEAGSVERHELRGQQFIGNQDRAFGQVRHGRGGFACECGNQLPLYVDQVGNAFDQQRIAGRADRLCMGAGGRAPGEGGTFPLRQPDARAAQQFGIVEQGEMRCGDGGAGTGAAGIQFPAQRMDRGVESGGFMGEAIALLRYLRVGGAELDDGTER